MRKTVFTFVALCCVAIFSGCSKQDLDSGASDINFTCNLNETYAPVSSAIKSFTPFINSTTTVIALHGELSSPLSPHMQRLESDLNTNGYNTIMPYMPWHENSWNGTMCQSISYLHKLILEQKVQGQNVILLGHSMAAPIVLAYSALKDTVKPDAAVVAAPSYFIHQSAVLATAHASSLELAKSMIENNQSNETATFETYSDETAKNIFTTPTIYLSYHDTAKFPNIENTIPAVYPSVLWLAGSSDPLTTVANDLGITSIVERNFNYSYKVTGGDHFTLLNNAADEIDSWY